MVQRTLESYLVRSEVDAHDRQDKAKESSNPTSHGHSSIIRDLHGRECGSRRDKQSRSVMELYGCCRYHQVATLAHSSTAGTHHAAVRGIQINAATGKVAWVQENGLLHLSSTRTLQHAAAMCQQRAADAAAAVEGSAESIAAGGEQQQEATEGLAARRHAAWLCATGGSTSGKLYRVGQRLDDVAWDPHAACKLATAAGSACITLLDFGKASPTYTSLQLLKEPSRRMLCCVRYLPSGPYSLASSDAKAVYLWDVRRGTSSTAQLVGPGDLASAVEVLPGGHLVCAVSCQQQLLLWDLRKGSSSSGVKLLGAGGLFQHALLACLDLAAPLAAAQRRICPEVAAREFWVLRAVPHPKDPSVVALLAGNGSSAVYDMARRSVTHMALAPDLFHLSTTQHEDTTRFRKYGLKKGSWNAAGDAFWSATPSIDAVAWSPEQAQMGNPTPALTSGWAEVMQPSTGMVSTAGCPRFINPGTGMLRYSPAVTGPHHPREGMPERVEGLRQQVFSAARGIPGAADLADAMEAAHAQPHELLTSAPLSAAVAAAGGCSSQLLHSAVRRWEDSRRVAFGPEVVALSDWPTCFAPDCQGDDMWMGTRGGCVALARPSVVC